MTAIQVTRRAFLTGSLALASGLGTRAKADLINAKFIVIGDWGSGSIAQRLVAARMADIAENVRAQFVLSTGDNFYPNGVKSVRDAQWAANFEEIYDAPSLQIPWYITLGNHDHRGSIEAQVEYTGLSSRWRLLARYYKHSHALADGNEAAFFHLDTTPIEKRCKKAQLAWLARELSASRATWKIVVGHHPIYSGGKSGDSGELIALLKPILERYGVQAYLNGHDHHLEHAVIGSVSYITSGAGCCPRPAIARDGTRFVAGDQLGFMCAELSPTELAFEFIDERGRNLYRAQISAKRAGIVADAQEEPYPRQNTLPRIPPKNRCKTAGAS